MKKLLPLLLLLLFSVSCSAQRIEQAPVYKVIAKVDRIAGEEMTLHTSGGIYYAATRSDVVEKKKYVFWVEKVGDGKVVIVKVAMTTEQAQKDQETCKEELSNRTIISL